MRSAPEFWKIRSSWPSTLLAPVGFLYGLATWLRMRKSGWRAPVPVISVGNFTAGGAGKTPTAIAIAKALIARGDAPFFITRGYGGTERGPHRVAAGDTAGRVGDEALLLARIAPTIVSRERATGARLAIAQGADCLILDDALQNPSLAKDHSIAVVDGESGFGSGLPIPAGPLRAPIAWQIGQVDQVLVIGEDRTAMAATLKPGCPIRTATITAEALPLDGRRVLAFSGIALPAKFEATLRALGADIVETRHFGDHHPYSEAEARSLLATAIRLDARLVTTEKDHVRLGLDPACRELARSSLAVPIRLVAEPAFFETIYEALDAARRRTSTASGPE
jgi:tetraacyldisaccharide 4'-kinase